MAEVPEDIRKKYKTRTAGTHVRRMGLPYNNYCLVKPASICNWILYLTSISELSYMRINLVNFFLRSFLMGFSSVPNRLWPSLLLFYILLFSCIFSFLFYESPLIFAHYLAGYKKGPPTRSNRTLPLIRVIIS